MRTRELTLDGHVYTVTPYIGITNPGKFYGLALHAVRDHDTSLADDSFGDCSTFGSFYWRTLKSDKTTGDHANAFRYYSENDQGFVYEISATEYDAARSDYNAFEVGSQDDDDYEGPFVCAATGCGYFDDPNAAPNDPPSHCRKHRLPEHIDQVSAYYPADAGTILHPACAVDHAREKYGTPLALDDSDKYGAAHRYSATETDSPSTCDACGKYIERQAPTNDGWAEHPEWWIAYMRDQDEDPTDYLNDFARSYIAAALWSTNDDHDEPLDRNFDVDDIADESLASIVRDCCQFENAEAEALGHSKRGRRGHDVRDIAGFLFWMNRNGHGVGFWDGDEYPEPYATALSAASKTFGESDFYVGDDGKLHVSTSRAIPE